MVKLCLISSKRNDTYVLLENDGVRNYNNRNFILSYYFKHLKTETYTLIRNRFPIQITPRSFGYIWPEWRVVEFRGVLRYSFNCHSVIFTISNNLLSNLLISSILMVTVSFYFLHQESIIYKYLNYYN